jgi:RNA polymerase sigma factor (sigma-70 family)
MATGQLSGFLAHLHRATLLPDGGGRTDGQLLECFLTHHDEAAFEMLVRRHGPMVWGVCRRALTNRHDAEDAFQATFLVLVRKAASIRRRESVGSWLYGAAYRAALETRAARRRTRETQVNTMPEIPSAGEADVWRDLRPLLDRELSGLPDKYREAVILCELEGKTRKKAARQLGIPEGTLSSRLATARRKLARRLARHGVALSAGALAAVLSQDAASARLPTLLVVSTTRAATSVALGSATAAVVSARVAAITEGVLKTMLLSKLKILGGVLLAFLASAGAVLLLTTHPATAAPEDARPAANDEPPAEQPAKPAPQPGGTFFRVESDVLHAIAFAPDSQILAGGGADKKVRLWDLGNDNLIRALEGPKEPVRRVVFTKDGKTLAAGADDGIFLWNVMSGKLEAELHADLPLKPGEAKDPVFVNGLVFLPGDKLAAVYNYLPSSDDTRHSRILLWDLRGKKAETLYEERGSCFSLALSPDGTLLAAPLWGDSNGFKVWDLESRKVVWEEQAGPDFMSAVLFSPDGTKLAVGGGHSIEVNQGFRAEGRLWVFDVKAKKQLWFVKEPGNWTYSQISFTADGKGLLTGSSGPIRKYRIKGTNGEKVVSELRCWDTVTGTLNWKTEGELGSFAAVAASADGKKLAGSDNEQLMLFDPATGTLAKVLAKVQIKQ